MHEMDWCNNVSVWYLVRRSNVCSVDLVTNEELKPQTVVLPARRGEDFDKCVFGAVWVYLVKINKLKSINDPHIRLLDTISTPARLQASSFAQPHCL
jgi:hypothetical protein